MEIRTYLSILWRRKWIIAVTFVVTMIVAVGGTLMIPPTFTASATLRVAVNSNSVGYGDLLHTERLMNTFPSIIGGGPMLAELKQRLGTSAVPEIDVEFPSDSELMLIVIEDRDPELAARSANVLAELFIDSLRPTRTGRNFTITLIDPAVPPRSPSSPRKMLNIALGTMVGLAGGLGLAFLFENLDTTLYDIEQIEAATEAKVLAQIPQVKQRQPVIALNGNSPYGDAFRRLQTNLLVPDYGQPLQTLLVTSVEPDEGKSTIVANLALVMAQSGHKVIVVDCDLRRPSLDRIFDLPNDVGLSNVLAGDATLEDSIQQSDTHRVRVLTSGPPPHNPTDLLGSPEMSALLEELARRFDKVLLDTPALLPVIDAAVIAPGVDGTLLIVERDRVRRGDLETVLRQLSLSQANLIGVAVNRTKRSKRYDYYYQAIQSRHKESI